MNNLTKNLLIKPLLTGASIASPVVAMSWWLVWHNPRSHAAFIFGNVFYSCWVAAVLGGWIWFLKRW